MQTLSCHIDSLVLDGMVILADRCSVVLAHVGMTLFGFVVQLDLPSGEGMQQCFNQLGPVDVVINCAAISSPAACEKEVDTARLGSPGSPVMYFHCRDQQHDIAWHHAWPQLLS